MNSARFNKSQFVKLLTIEDPRKETILGVVGRMKVLLDLFQKDPAYHRLIPFLLTYYYVTKTSAEKYITKKHYFWSLKEHELLDVYFAHLYFKPLLSYLLDGEYVHPWEQYFKYCERKDGTPFLQMLLGINAHINSDLYTALVDLKYKNQSDFFLVNDILQEVIPEVMHFLAFSKHDMVGLTGYFFKNLTESEFHQIVERWRSVAWMNAKFTTPLNKKQFRERISEQTESIGEGLIRDFSGMYHVYNVSQILSSVNARSVRVI